MGWKGGKELKEESKMKTSIVEILCRNVSSTITHCYGVWHAV